GCFRHVAIATGHRLRAAPTTWSSTWSWQASAQRQRLSRFSSNPPSGTHAAPVNSFASTTRMALTMASCVFAPSIHRRCHPMSRQAAMRRAIQRAALSDRTHDNLVIDAAHAFHVAGDLSRELTFALGIHSASEPDIAVQRDHIDVVEMDCRVFYELGANA